MIKYIWYGNIKSWISKLFIKIELRYIFFYSLTRVFEFGGTMYLVEKLPGIHIYRKKYPHTTLQGKNVAS